MSAEPSSTAGGNIVVFHTDLMPYSQTFISNQAEKCVRYTPYYAGFKRKNGIELPVERTIQPASSRLVAKAREVGAVAGVAEPMLLAKMRRLQPRLIHAHFEESGVKTLPYAERLQIPLVVTCHGYDVTREDLPWSNVAFFGSLYQRARRRLMSRGKFFLGISQFICDHMIRRGFPPARVRQHYIGVDTEYFQPAPTPARKPVVLFVGRLVEKKGCADLIVAMAPLQKKYPDVQLVVVGDGPLEAELKSLAHEKGVNASFVGARDADYVRRAMCEALLLCTPSVRSRSGDSEGLGMVVLEAMAVGTPVVATRHGGIPEVVEHHVTGILCGERNLTELQDAIGSLLADPSLGSKMGRAGRERAVRHFDLQTQTRVLEGIYSEMTE